MYKLVTILIYDFFLLYEKLFDTVTSVKDGKELGGRININNEIL